LVTLINIFVLLLALGVIAALYVTNWVTKPLKTLQDSLASIQLGKLNKQLDYVGSDEIGSLVKVYNQKVEELEQAASALARSERESAWREMARQVAHEIKNPLTPMKLSVQHFQRTFNKDDEGAQERLERFSKMLIEQIDTLTNIANEFSSFAKMPMSKAEGVVVSEVVSNVVQLFVDSSEAQVLYENEGGQARVFIDKDELIRVLTNLVKNAVQALQVQREGKILIRTWLVKGKVYVSVADNGSGIAKEARGKIFQPNFTTKSSGTGLGLAMVKSIVEQSGGQVWFEDNPQGGTIFFVEFPEMEG
jgi:nitrogen fixation/metabolism regulation signal transduction histidine kinase